MFGLTLRVPLQWWHLKHDLWYTLLSAVSCSTQYTFFWQAVHFWVVPANDAISNGDLEFQLEN